MTIQARGMGDLNPVSQLPLVVPLGSLTATTNNIVGVKLPSKARLKRIDLYAQAVTGTTPTLSVTPAGSVIGAQAATSNLTAAGAAGLTSSEYDVAFGQNETITLSATLGGTTPDYTNVYAVLHFSLADRRDVDGTTQGVSY